jgi:nucleoid-associated protein YgaU
MELPKVRAFLAERNNPLSRVDFHFNPTTITFNKRARYERKGSQSAATDPPVQFTGIDATSLKLDILLDAVEEQPVGTVLHHVERLLSWMSPTAGILGEIFGKSVSPPELQFTWGALTINGAHTFIGHLEDVNVTYELFSRDGRPLRAQVSLTLGSRSDEVTGTNPTSGAERSRRSHVLRLGESLQSLAYSAYGDASAWRKIAELNEIDDPLRVGPGRELLLPDAAELSGIVR